MCIVGYLSHTLYIGSIRDLIVIFFLLYRYILRVYKLDRLGDLLKCIVGYLSHALYIGRIRDLIVIFFLIVQT